MNLQILRGDCRDVLPTLESGSMQCCVTSPPYWGLRDYGTAQWEGGDAECNHVERLSRQDGERETPGGRGGSFRSSAVQYRDECGKCGARRIDSQLGLEVTPEEYIETMVAVFRDVWRVLRDDGTLWLNLGDSYCSTAPGTMGDIMGNMHLGEAAAKARQKFRPETPSGLKPKDLCMMPARLAMALQADGWYLRSDIIWAKPNPMPESVTDRPTKAHEYIFLLTKQERYYYDAEAIREQRAPLQGSTYSQPDKAARANQGTNGTGATTLRNRECENRNKRTVWTIATQPYAEAHFATFPEEIPKLCILAGSKVGDTVLDPFGGSGTVGQVALELGRKAILIELNPDYIKLAEKRTFVTPGLPL